MTAYQRLLKDRAPELNAAHMETLAYAVGSTLNGMPGEFFDDVVALARSVGPKNLELFHLRAIA